jgi:hypothetical protein
MSDLLQTCLVIVQLSTGSPAMTMVWPDGQEARAMCETEAVRWNVKGVPDGFRAECRPTLPCPYIKDAVPYLEEKPS